MTGFWLLLFFGLLLLFAVIGSTTMQDDPDASWIDAFALERYEWYGELKTDVRSALRQLARDRDRVLRFISSNAAWGLATATGIIGLLLTALMIIGFIPPSTKTALAKTLVADQTIAQVASADLIETKTSIPDYVFTAHDPSVSMEVKGLVYQRLLPQTPIIEPDRVIIPAGVEEIRAREPVDYRRSVRVFDKLPPKSSAAVADDHRELVVVAQPTTGALNRLPPEQHDLFEEVVKGDVRRKNQRIVATLAGLYVEKIYPESTAPGNSVHYEIVLKNTVGTLIERVRVEETIPEQARLLNTVPRGERSIDDGQQVWIVDRLEPDETQTIRVEVDAGELDSVRTNTRILVSEAYSDPADLVVAKESITAKTDPATRPMAKPKTEPEVVRSRKKATGRPPEPKVETIGRIRIEITGPKRARVGDDITLKFRLYNYGAEPIDNASIRVRLAAQLRGAGGDVWRTQIQPVLEPGQSRIAIFRGKAVAAGTAVNRIDVLFGSKVVRSGERRLDIVNDDNRE